MNPITVVQTSSFSLDNFEERALQLLPQMEEYQTVFILSEQKKQSFSFESIKSFLQANLSQSDLYNITYTTDLQSTKLQDVDTAQKNICIVETFPQDWNSNLSYLDFIKSLAEQAQFWLVDYLPFFYKTSTLFAKFPVPVGYSSNAQKEQAILERIFSSGSNKVLLGGGKQLADLLKLSGLFVNFFDVFLFAGKNCHTLLHSRLISVGDSAIDKNLLSDCFQLIDKLIFHNKKFFLPVDHIAQNSINGKTKAQKNEIQKGFLGIDIGNKTISLYKDHIKKASFIVYYGSVSCIPFDKNNISKSDVTIIKAVINSPAEKIIVGDEAIAIAKSLDLLDQFSWVIENENLLLDVSIKEFKK